MKKKQVEALFQELVAAQQEKVLTCGRSFIPNLTTEDALQPNDYPQLETNPYFRYEEGVLEGILTVRAAMAALFNETEQEAF